MWFVKKQTTNLLISQAIYKAFSLPIPPQKDHNQQRLTKND